MELKKGGDWKTTAITVVAIAVAGYALYKSKFGQALELKLTGSIQDQKTK